MFVRTQRLTLRPAWPEDAAELAHAIGHESVVRNLAHAPWPYSVEAAESFANTFSSPTEPKFLIFEHVGDTVRLIGCVAASPLQGSEYEFGYWLTPDAWGRGYATEAGAAVLRAAKAAGVRKVQSGHFIDNPASGRVLRKLGFRPTGHVASTYSLGRGAEAPSARFELDLSESEDACDMDPDARLAA